MAPPADEHDGGTTVLIVDDEQNVADLYATWVEMSSDYEVTVAYDGPTALEAVTGGEADDDADSDEPPTAAVDAVLLDRRMPGMSGDEVLKELRERGYRVPVAMVTAVKLEDAPLEADYQEYLTKPVMRDDVGRIVRTLVEYDPAEAVGDTGEAEDAEGGDDADGDAETGDTEADGEVSDELKDTLDEVTQKLDRIQDSVTEEDDGDDPPPEDEDLVTAEDIRQQIGQGDGDAEAEAEDDQG